jgi:UDP-glucose:(heptosyl)LPS alpha-1,3-glucosyltransferase
VIANGVKTNIQPDTQKAEGIRRRIFEKLDLTESDEPVLMLFAANNFRLKGLGQLIKAMSLASNSSQQRPICLIIAGAGKELRYKLLARKLGLNNRIVFLGKLSSIQNALSVCDVAVLPSWYDPCSRFILEALAMGKPVITSRLNGASEAFTDGLHGQIIATPGDIETLSKAMLYFTETNNIISASQAIVRDKIADRVSIKRHAAELTELYNTILQNKT